MSLNDLRWEPVGDMADVTRAMTTEGTYVYRYLGMFIGVTKPSREGDHQVWRGIAPDGLMFVTTASEETAVVALLGRVLAAQMAGQVYTVTITLIDSDGNPGERGLMTTELPASLNVADPQTQVVLDQAVRHTITENGRDPDAGYVWEITNIGLDVRSLLVDESKPDEQPDEQGDLSDEFAAFLDEVARKLDRR